MADSFLMEACVDSVESAINAEKGGAVRLELCSSLLEGGITPSIGLLQVVKQNVKVPVYVMIRPRGGDFLYSECEVEVMKRDIGLVKSNGADGLVLGVLTDDGRVDTELCMELLAVARPLPVTFHRAFDMVQDPVVALETLVSLGFERLLTSGCEHSALEGLPLIRRLVEQAKGRIVIMPGGGITERNLQRILEGSGALEFHCSARSTKDSAMKFRNTCVNMGASLSAPEYGLKVADVRKEMTDIMKSIYDMMGKYTYPNIQEDAPREHVDSFFEKMDRNNDGVVTIDEFIESCQKDENIMQSMQLFDNVI